MSEMTGKGDEIKPSGDELKDDDEIKYDPKLMDALDAAPSDDNSDDKAPKLRRLAAKLWKGLDRD